MDTAEFMHSGGRYFYSVFMCHLAIEKALKGLYQHKLGQIPPKTHNLVYLLACLKLRPEEKTGTFMVKLNEANIATRYPEDLAKLQKNYTAEVCADILTRARETLQWIKRQF